MRIVVMDDVLLSEKHVQVLESYGELIRHEGIAMSSEEIIDRASGAEILISGWTQYPGSVFDDLPDLKMISLWSTGMDYLDIDSARAANIKVTNVPGYAKNAVAELAFGLILAVLRKIPAADRNVRENGCYNWNLFSGGELTGKTLGILGTGAIGLRVAEIAKGFNMKVLAYDPYPNSDAAIQGTVKYTEFEEIFKNSDIVSVHMPLLPETKEIIKAEHLSLMPSHSIFVNTARAGLVDQSALYSCLQTGKIAGAGLDDVDLEAPTGKLFMEMEGVVLTPHIGFNTAEATQVKTEKCIQNVMDFLKNHDNMSRCHSGVFSRKALRRF